MAGHGKPNRRQQRLPSRLPSGIASAHVQVSTRGAWLTCLHQEERTSVVWQSEGVRPARRQSTESNLIAGETTNVSHRSLCWSPSKSGVRPHVMVALCGEVMLVSVTDVSCGFEL
ncbi:hypothetical protein BHE74_00007795 [Ensete ventricosum]|nr:hypothetical protein GW17_00017782 [Ensete ventricosum]RWW83691.1 hypothetical protein BHE74_00007795 [Ensete ventricosum]RZS02401.1 hypothetical protein BHM03_00032438 [Ensete ventricosum]